MIAKKTDANLLHPSFRLKALATTAQRPVEKDLFPAKVGDDVDTFQLAIQITFVGGEHFEEADIVQLEKLIGIGDRTLVGYGFHLFQAYTLHLVQAGTIQIQYFRISFKAVS